MIYFFHLFPYFLSRSVGVGISSDTISYIHTHGPVISYRTVPDLLAWAKVRAEVPEVIPQVLYIKRFFLLTSERSEEVHFLRGVRERA